MENFIGLITVLLIIAYVCFAIWTICKRRTLAGSLGASAGFLCGGLLIIPLAGAIATFLGWTIVIILVLSVLSAVLT